MKNFFKSKKKIIKEQTEEIIILKGEVEKLKAQKYDFEELYFEEIANNEKDFQKRLNNLFRELNEIREENKKLIDKNKELKLKLNKLYGGKNND